MRVWIVILSFLACGRGEAPATPTPAPSLGADAAPAGTSRNADGPAPSSPPRPRVPLLERRGDSEGPIPYRVVEPGRASAKTPLVVALHGRGDTAEGFARLVMRLGLDARVIVAEAPLPFGMSGGRQWFEAGAADAASQVRARVQDLARLVDKLAALHPEAGKPALFGFSQGAVLALQAAHELPDRFRRVAALSGYLASEEGAATPATPLPVLITAGTKDHVIPQDKSWAAALVLEKQGLAVRRFAFAGPHSVPPAVERELAEFLAAP